MVVVPPSTRLIPEDCVLDLQAPPLIKTILVWSCASVPNTLTRNTHQSLTQMVSILETFLSSLHALYLGSGRAHYYNSPISMLGPSTTRRNCQ